MNKQYFCDIGQLYTVSNIALMVTLRTKCTAVLLLNKVTVYAHKLYKKKLMLYGNVIPRLQAENQRVSVTTVLTYFVFVFHEHRYCLFHTALQGRLSSERSASRKTHQEQPFQDRRRRQRAWSRRGRHRQGQRLQCRGQRFQRADCGLHQRRSH